MAQLLIDHGADVKSTDGSLAPLEDGAASGMAGQLIANGALYLEVPPLRVARKECLFFKRG